MAEIDKVPPKTVTKSGADLRVGDTIKVWWKPGRDTIMSLQPYDGKLNELFHLHGAQIAGFALSTVSMTVENGLDYEVVVP